ncbi:MAG: AmmeMemoRadiSam system protein B [archaeon GB-1845-036]|nr:AmmeMemoRadiSam system protein B [Candidatus Culexmicrobium thermophilum]
MTYLRIRDPVVAGMFYEYSPDSLKLQIEQCFKHRLGPGFIPEVHGEFKGSLLGVVSPHAGYMYSGPVASWSFKALAENGKPDSFIIIGPNHSGVGAPLSILREGCWRTPLGVASIDSELADEILSHCDLLEVDWTAHLSEHSIEVQLPFLQYLFGNVKFVPISMMLQNFEVSRAIGEGLAETIKNRRVTIIASTDFSHYVPLKQAVEDDSAIIEKILTLDAKGMFDVFYSRRVSMCGPGVVAAMLVACKMLGASRGVKLKYATSGDVTGDVSSVVGYAAIAIYR